MLSCKEITDKANDYLEKDLPFFVRLKFNMHLKMCINCRRYVEQLQTTIQLLGKMKQPVNTDESTVDSMIELLKRNDNESKEQ